MDNFETYFQYSIKNKEEKIVRELNSLNVYVQNGCGGAFNLQSYMNNIVTLQIEIRQIKEVLEFYRLIGGK